jgi:predicted MFS family arabinose efflux permease
MRAQQNLTPFDTLLSLLISGGPLMRTKLWSLTLGNFAIGTGAMIVPGMLNELTADLGTTPVAIGVIISAFAITICLGAPFFASWTSAIERRKLLTAALAWYAFTHVLAALAPGYNTLLVVRVLTAVAAALFTAQAAATAGLMVHASERGKAIGLVILGWSFAAVIGMPLGTYLGAHIGWRPTMALVGLVSGLMAAWVWIQIPARLYVASLDFAAWKSVLTNKPLMTVVSVTAIQAAGMFTVFAYMALVLKEFIGAGPTTISILFACFGVTGVIGNVLAARMVDRIGTVRVILIALVCMVVPMFLWPLTRGSLAMTVILMLIWGLGCFAVNGAQQARLLGLAPRVASASISLNTSAMYFGQAFGALVGGAVIASFGLVWLSIIGAVLVLIAIVASQVAAGMADRQALAQAA